MRQISKYDLYIYNETKHHVVLSVKTYITNIYKEARLLFDFSFRICKVEFMGTSSTSTIPAMYMDSTLKSYHFVEFQFGFPLYMV